MEKAPGEGGIGRTVRAARERRGWSRESLAHHSGLSWGAIAQIESGRRSSLRPTTLDALADALGVSVDYLLGRARPAKPTALLQHRALFYSTAEEFVAGVLPAIDEGLTRGDAVLVVTTSANRRILRRAVSDARKDVTYADCEKWYRSLPSALGAYQRFIETRLDEGRPWVRIAAELPVSRSMSGTDDWVRYEALANVALANYPAEIICAYGTAAVSGDVVRRALDTHPEIVEPDGPAPNSKYVEPSEVLCQVPQ